MVEFSPSYSRYKNGAFLRRNVIFGIKESSWYMIHVWYINVFLKVISLVQLHYYYKTC